MIKDLIVNLSVDGPDVAGPFAIAVADQFAQVAGRDPALTKLW